MNNGIILQYLSWSINYIPSNVAKKSFAYDGFNWVNCNVILIQLQEFYPACFHIRVIRYLIKMQTEEQAIDPKPHSCWRLMKKLLIKLFQNKKSIMKHIMT